MKKYAIIVAGGSGSRMGTALPKQFLLLNDKPVLYYTIQAFLSAYNDMQIILVLPQGYLDKGKELIAAFFPEKSIQLVSGGETRFHSVKNGLQQVKEESIVFVHDGVRCLLSDKLIQRCYKTALEKGSAIPVIKSKDSVRLQNETGNEVFDREKVLLVQTPQTFRSEIILPALGVEYQPSFTDEATVVEASGTKIALVEGEETNIKITLPVDLAIAQLVLDSRNT